MLRSVEELLLLLIDEKRGDLISTPAWTLACTLAGAILMDLALEGRIDTDSERLVLLDSTPLQDELLDPVLAEITQNGKTHNAPFWVERIAARGGEICDRVLSQLMARAILEVQEDGFLSFLPSMSHARRYPSPGREAREDVRLRVMRVLFSDDVPDPRDIVVISLADACGAFERLLSPAEIAQVNERITLVSRMDLIGRSVVDVIRTSEPPSGSAPPDREIPVARRPPLISILLGRSFILDQYLKLGPVFQIEKNKLTRLLEAVFVTKPLAKRGQKDSGRLIVMAGPEANRFFSKNDKAHFRSREFWMRFDEQFDAKATRSMISAGGEDHFRMRRIKRPGYSRTVGENQISGILDVTRREIASWPEDAPIAGTMMSKRLVYNLMCRIMTGISAPEYFEDFTTLFEAAFKSILGLYPSRLRRSRLRRARERLDELTTKIIALHEPQHRGNRPPDIIDHVLALHRADPQFMPETDLGIAILEPIFAPVHTMAHTISFMLYELLKRPDLLQRARTEADALFTPGTPTAQGVQQLDVTKRTYMETLRLYSTVPRTVRTVSNSFEFTGCTIPAGQQVILEFTLPHHMPAYFPNPEQFDIDRFAPPRNEHQQPGAYVPYGVGTHRCIGSHLAEFLATTAMATVLHDAELALDPPDYVLTDRKIMGLPTPHPNKSFRFRLLGRRWSKS